MFPPIILYGALFASLIILIAIVIACVLDKNTLSIAIRISLICLCVLGLVLVSVQIGDLASTTEIKSQVDGIVLRTDIEGDKNLIWVEVKTEDTVAIEVDDNVFAHVENGQVVKLEKTNSHSWLDSSTTYTLLADGT